MPLPRPAMEARSGSLEPGQPSRARSASTRHPGRAHMPPADRMYVTDVRQTDVRQHHRLMPQPMGAGIRIYYSRTVHQHVVTTAIIVFSAFFAFFCNEMEPSRQTYFQPRGKFSTYVSVSNSIQQLSFILALVSISALCPLLYHV